MVNEISYSYTMKLEVLTITNGWEEVEIDGGSSRISYVQSLEFMQAMRANYTENKTRIIVDFRNQMEIY